MFESGGTTMMDDVVVPWVQVGVGEEQLPCPSPVCSGVPASGDRYCEACGTWLGVDGEVPPSGGPIQKALRNSGALKLAGIVERVEGTLNDWCD